MSSMSTFSARLFRMSGRLEKAASLFRFRLWPRDWAPQELLLWSPVQLSCAAALIVQDPLY